MRSRSIKKLFLCALVCSMVGSSLSSCSSAKKGFGVSEDDYMLNESGNNTQLSDADLESQNANNANRYSDGSSIPEAGEDGIFEDIRFAYDSSVVPRESYDMLKKMASVLQNTPNMKVEIEGHTDKRGTNEYNMVLGEERAKAVRNLLKDFGANAKQLAIIS